jgi:hypothetical protein
MGRSAKTTDAEKQAIRAKLASGMAVSQAARDTKISRASVIAIRDAA